MDHADFAAPPQRLRGNLVHSAVPSMIHSNDGLRFDRNLYWYAGPREPKWSYGGREHVGFSAWRRDTGQDAAALRRSEAHGHAAPAQRVSASGFGANVGAELGDREQGAANRRRQRSTPTREAGPRVRVRGGRRLAGAGSSSCKAPSSSTAERPRGGGGAPGGASSQLPSDWNLGAIGRSRLRRPRETSPRTRLVAPDGAVLRLWEGFVHPLTSGSRCARCSASGGIAAVELPRDDGTAAPRRRSRRARAAPPRRRLPPLHGAGGPRKALQAVRSLGLERVQVSRLPDRFYTPEGAREFSGLLKEAGLRADAVVVVFQGESYKDQDSVMRTVGLRPAALRPRDGLREEVHRLREGHRHGDRHVSHGFLPRDPKDPVYGEMQDAVSALRGLRRLEGRHPLARDGAGERRGAGALPRRDHRRPRRRQLRHGQPRALRPRRPAPRARAPAGPRHVAAREGRPAADDPGCWDASPTRDGRAQVRACLRLLDAAGFRGPLIIENYTWRDGGTDPLQELARARDFILAERPSALSQGSRHSSTESIRCLRSAIEDRPGAPRGESTRGCRAARCRGWRGPARASGTPVVLAQSGPYPRDVGRRHLARRPDLLQLAGDTACLGRMPSFASSRPAAPSPGSETAQALHLAVEVRGGRMAPLRLVGHADVPEPVGELRVQLQRLAAGRDRPS